jgi:hypothetical protein
MNLNLLTMKMFLTTGALICAMLVSSSFTVSAQKRKKDDKEAKGFRYEIEAMKTGVQGTYLIKVWSYSKQPMMPADLAKKNAVHGIIFKGFPAKDGVPGQLALAADPAIETEKAEFFENFFKDGGDFLKYVTLVGDGQIAPEDRIRMGKEFKIGLVVSVDVAALRRALEDAGIIKKLDDGFTS